MKPKNNQKKRKWNLLVMRIQITLLVFVKELAQMNDTKYKY
jgi:hypothetical protein